MHLLRTTLGLILVFGLTIFMHVYVSALVPPFNVIHVFSVTLVLLWLFTPKDMLVWYALAFGTLLDFIEGTPLGVYGAVFFISLAIITFLHQVLITQEKPLSIFLLILIFMTVTRASEHFVHMRINTLVLEESIVAIAINTSIACVLYLTFIMVQKELAKRFI